MQSTPNLFNNSKNIFGWNQSEWAFLFSCNCFFIARIAYRLSHDWTHRDFITSLVAKMRVCCFGSPSIFMVTNVRKCQTERVNIFWIYFAFILNSGSFFFLFTKFFQNKTKEKATRTQNKFQIYQIIQFGIFLHLWL